MHYFGLITIVTLTIFTRTVAYKCGGAAKCECTDNYVDCRGLSLRALPLLPRDVIRHHSDMLDLQNNMITRFEGLYRLRGFKNINLKGNVELMCSAVPQDFPGNILTDCQQFTVPPVSTTLASDPETHLATAGFILGVLAMVIMCILCVPCCDALVQVIVVYQYFTETI